MRFSLFHGGSFISPPTPSHEGTNHFPLALNPTIFDKSALPDTEVQGAVEANIEAYFE
jgi:hypothetical protein